MFSGIERTTRRRYIEYSIEQRSASVRRHVDRFDGFDHYRSGDLFTKKRQGQIGFPVPFGHDFAYMDIFRIAGYYGFVSAILSFFLFSTNFLIDFFFFRPITANKSAQAFYFVKCVYFLLSAWQIRNAYP